MDNQTKHMLENINGLKMIIEHLVYHLEASGQLDRHGLAKTIEDDAQRIIQARKGQTHSDTHIMKLFAADLHEDLPRVGDWTPKPID